MTEVYHPGERVAFGRYRQLEKAPEAQDIVWIVLAQQDHFLLLLSEKLLEVYPYQRRRSGNAWESSLPRNWLNTVFLQTAFDREEQMAMVPFSANGEGGEARDLVTLPGEADILRYLPREQDRKAAGTGHAIRRGLRTRGGAGWWWLRNRGASEDTAKTVAFDGALDQDMTNCDGVGLRPMICLDVSEDIRS